ncbi:MAG: phosphoglycerate kinase [Candidatus Dormibacteria bacterium]
MARGPHAIPGLDDINVAGKRVLLRVDFNVPLDSQGAVRDDSRLRASLPTIRDLLERGAAVIVATHLGRPGGKPDPALSTLTLVPPLEQLLHRPVAWAPDCVGPEVERRVADLQPGQVLLLENLRFHPEEEANDPGFAGQLAGLGDAYVNDAFAASHRAHASTEAVAGLLPAAAGRLMAEEVSQLGALLASPRRPLLAIIGGSKLSTKLGILQHLIEKVETLCLGGAMAATFLKAAGLEVGRSLVEDDFLDSALDLVAQATRRGAALELPADVVVAPAADAGPDEVRTKAVQELDPGDMILDLGPRTVERWQALIATAGTVVWNGPLGLYEVPRFAKATEQLARALAASPARSVTGGGDLLAALQRLGLEGSLSHVSTGGGATLEFLEGKTLPGVAALEHSGRDSSRDRG